MKKKGKVIERYDIVRVFKDGKLESQSIVKTTTHTTRVKEQLDKLPKEIKKLLEREGKKKKGSFLKNFDKAMEKYFEDTKDKIRYD